MCLPHAAHPGHRVHHHYPCPQAGYVQCRKQVSPRLEPERLLRDLPDNDRRILPVTGRRTSILGRSRYLWDLLAAVQQVN